MIEYHIDIRAQIVHCRVSGMVNPLALSNYFERLTHDPDFHPRLDTLVDISDASALKNAAHRKLLAGLLHMWSEYRSGSKWAMVWPDPSSSTLAEEIARKQGFQAIALRCFTDRAEALAWLRPGSP
ncbi:MAG TPA: hypothetical protein PK879_01470 [Opitutaceae bacterium]|jgi:hypothetical protein|nr:MAG: hypothetical protein BWX86_01365 [Verrucomicrobia bacterium ADurb.Bin122]HOF10520.1 hypothetical protein [Opitutaceae bacterium]HOR25822.1 hypothetical protein [Opitutaceae bacterium]HPK50190.1 hypothetical protein [Opitutaceae bacterium]HPN99353.1 hypothetical protein [Opitutaceae bacterium]